MFWHILAPTVQIYVQLQKQDESARYALELNGHVVCQRTWRLCLGVGKSRMTKIRNAIINGRDCPGDGRYVPKMHETPPPPGSAREKCHEFFRKGISCLGRTPPRDSLEDAGTGRPSQICSCQDIETTRQTPKTDVQAD